MKEMKITDNQVVDLVKSEKPWNVARRIFATHMARISARGDLSPLELRRMELRAVADIAYVFGTLLSPDPDPSALKPVPPSPWAESEALAAPGNQPATGGPPPSPERA
jgi:hypothetical protein